ncbi:MAG: hypothetical protein AB1657_03875 [Candidatus Micrarchaeota archaeon]
MERNRMLSWTQTHEVLEELMEGFERGEENPRHPVGAPEPVSLRRKNGVTCIRYKWNETPSAQVRIESIRYSDGNLRYLHSVDAKEGADTAVFTHSGATYIMRRTALRAAKRLFACANAIRGCISRIVAWFKTLAGSVYIVSRVDKSTWSLDEQLSAPHLQSTSWDYLGPSHRSRFAELATEMMVKLHRSGYVFANPVPSGFMLDSGGALVADPRDLRPMKRTSDAVDNFILMMRGLFLRGFTCSGTLFYCLSLYANSMEEECRGWHRKNGNSGPADLFGIAQELERHITA